MQHAARRLLAPRANAAAAAAAAAAPARAVPKQRLAKRAGSAGCPKAKDCWGAHALTPGLAQTLTLDPTLTLILAPTLTPTKP